MKPCLQDGTLIRNKPQFCPSQGLRPVFAPMTKNRKQMIHSLRFTLFPLMLGIALVLPAQPASGRIEYEFTRDMHRELPPERADLRSLIPQHLSTYYELLFHGHTSLYTRRPEPDPSPQRMGMRMPGAEVYIDREAGEMTSQLDFLNRQYLIHEAFALEPWRLGNERLEILGYTCSMAWMNDTLKGEEITAWFTTSLPPLLGPDRFATLPGAVLAVDINNGERVWVARSVQMQDVDPDGIRKPRRGEPVSRSQYEQMVLEQTERMRRMGSSFR
jgi:GLPGLI family protein